MLRRRLDVAVLCRPQQQVRLSFDGAVRRSLTALVEAVLCPGVMNTETLEPRQRSTTSAHAASRSRPSASTKPPTCSAAPSETWMHRSRCLPSAERVQRCSRLSQHPVALTGGVGGRGASPRLAHSRRGGREHHQPARGQHLHLPLRPPAPRVARDSPGPDPPLLGNAQRQTASMTVRVHLRERGKGTRRVQLVRRDGRDVSTLYGREGGGRGGGNTHHPRSHGVSDFSANGQVSRMAGQLVSYGYPVQLQHSSGSFLSVRAPFGRGRRAVGARGCRARRG